MALAASGEAATGLEGASFFSSLLPPVGTARAARANPRRVSRKRERSFMAKGGCRNRGGRRFTEPSRNAQFLFLRIGGVQPGRCAAAGAALARRARPSRRDFAPRAQGC